MPFRVDSLHQGLEWRRGSAQPVLTKQPVQRCFLGAAEQMQQVGRSARLLIARQAPSQTVVRTQDAPPIAIHLKTTPLRASSQISGKAIVQLLLHLLVEDDTLLKPWRLASGAKDAHQQG